ncbi:MAG: hypothetical protein AAB624_02095 [Patescibacteria group bacterium]
MKIRIPRFRPASRASTTIHSFLNIFLALLILAIIVDPISLPSMAVVVLLLSKWRMLAVKPRHWLANVRANLVDITVGLAVIAFMSGTGSLITQLIWAGLYSAWLILLKPRSDTFSIALQAMVAQALGLVAFYGSFSNSSIIAVVLLTWLICYSSARHFFSGFEDDSAHIISHIWGLFGAELAWVLSHWTLTYGFIPQIALLLTVIGYCLAVCYYLHSLSRLKITVRNQFIFVTVLVIVVVALFSEWQYSGL